MPPHNMNMQQSATYTVRAFRYSTTLTGVFFYYAFLSEPAVCVQQLLEALQYIIIQMCFKTSSSLYRNVV